jgi:hypothetical protein
VPVCMYVCVCARSYDVCMLCMDTYIYIYIYIYIYSCMMYDTDAVGGGTRLGAVSRQVPSNYRYIIS